MYFSSVGMGRLVDADDGAHSRIVNRALQPRTQARGTRGVGVAEVWFVRAQRVDEPST